MKKTQSEPRYPATSIVLHWLTLALIIAVFPLGMLLERAPEGWGDTLYRLHWSFGLSILALIILRLINRHAVGTPPPYAGLTSLERRLSGLVHLLLYVMLLVAPLLGWLGKSAYGGPITVFGLFDMPPLIGQDEALSKSLLGAHKIAVKVLLALIALHVAGALNHALIKKDGVFRRMWPRA